MLKINPDMKREPYGGHHYPEYGVTFTGDSVDGVVDKVADFRLNNNIPAGNPLQDILQFYAEHFPWMVMKDENPPKTYRPRGRYLLWREWIYGQWKNPPKKTLTNKEASDRWKICLECPFLAEKNWAETDESLELSRRAFMLRRGAEVPEKLGYCSLHRTDLSVFVFLVDPVVQSAKLKDGASEEKCWVK